MENGIEKYIELNCNDSDLLCLKKETIKQLSSIFNLNEIDWEGIYEKSCKSLAVESWKLFNSGKTTTEICKILKKSDETARRYLKQGALLGIINYNPKEMQRRNRKQVGKSFSKTVLQYSLEGVFMAKFDSASDVEDALGFSAKNIRACCSKHRKNSHGFIWEYKEE